MALRPDCADLVYFLRAYFAYKTGLPFGYCKCSRGEAAAMLRLVHQRKPDSSRPGQTHPVGRPEYLRDRRRHRCHSGAVRVLANDDNTDYYTGAAHPGDAASGNGVRRSLWARDDVVRRVPEADGAAGVFLSVDGQPDGTVARKRFWRGNFLFAHEPALGSPGFKRFRPIVREANGALAAADQRRNRQRSELRRLLPRTVAAFGRRLLRPHGRGDVAGAARPVAGDEGSDRFARGAGEDAGDIDRERSQVPEQRQGRGHHAGRRRDLRNHRRVGRFLHAVPRFPAVDRDRRGARLSRSGRPPTRALRHAGGQERGRRQSRVAERARRRAILAQVYAIRAATARNGRSRSRTSSIARPTSRWATTPTTASSCAGARRRAARKRRPASGMRRRRNARRWPITAAGSAPGIGRPARKSALRAGDIAGPRPTR